MFAAAQGFFGSAGEPTRKDRLGSIAAI